MLEAQQINLIKLAIDTQDEKILLSLITNILFASKKYPDDEISATANLLILYIKKISPENPSNEKDKLSYYEYLNSVIKRCVLSNNLSGIKKMLGLLSTNDAIITIQRSENTSISATPTESSTYIYYNEGLDKIDEIRASVVAYKGNNSLIPYSKTPIHLLAQLSCLWNITDTIGNRKIIENLLRLFLEQDLNVNQKDTSNHSALDYAVMNQDSHLVELLLNSPKIEMSCIDADEYEFGAKNTLTAAIKTANHEILNTLINFLIKPENRDMAKRVLSTTNNNPLATAIEANDSEAIQALLSLGQVHQINADLMNLTDKMNATPLITACATSNSRVMNISTLISLGADVNAANLYGYTPIMYAAMYGDISFLKTLITSGADPDMENEFGENALSLALINSENFHDFDATIALLTPDKEKGYYNKKNQFDIALLWFYFNKYNSGEYDNNNKILSLILTHTKPEALSYTHSISGENIFHLMLKNQLTDTQVDSLNDFIKSHKFDIKPSLLVKDKDGKTPIENFNKKTSKKLFDFFLESSGDELFAKIKINDFYDKLIASPLCMNKSDQTYPCIAELIQFVIKFQGKTNVEESVFDKFQSFFSLIKVEEEISAATKIVQFLLKNRSSDNRQDFLTSGLSNELTILEKSDALKNIRQRYPKIFPVVQPQKKGWNFF